MTVDGAAAQVPLAWFGAQDTASRLIETGGMPWPRASFEYRATHDVLALTLLLTGVAGEESIVSGGRLRAQRKVLEDDVGWAAWCEHLLTRYGSAADADSASRAYRWLTRSRLLGGALNDLYDLCGVTARRQGAGLSIGVIQARLLLDRKLACAV